MKKNHIFVVRELLIQTRSRLGVCLFESHSLDRQERREEQLMERIHVLEEEKEELEERCKERHGRKSEKDEKGKEGVEDTERMLLAVLRELEGIPRCNMSSSPFPPF